MLVQILGTALFFASLKQLDAEKHTLAGITLADGFKNRDILTYPWCNFGDEHEK